MIFKNFQNTYQISPEAAMVFFGLGGPSEPGSTVGDGTEAKYQTSAPTPTLPGSLKPKLQDAQNTYIAQQNQYNAATGVATAIIERGVSVPTAITQDVSISPFSRTALASADAEARPLVKLSAPLEQIKKMLATTGHELKSATKLVNKQTTLTAQYNKEGSIIAALETQLAAQTKASSEAKIQKKITADEKVQTKYLNEDTGVYNTANTDLDNISTLETDIQTALNALPS